MRLCQELGDNEAIYETAEDQVLLSLKASSEILLQTAARLQLGSNSGSNFLKVYLPFLLNSSFNPFKNIFFAENSISKLNV